MKYFVIALNYQEARDWTMKNKQRIYEEHSIPVGSMQYLDSIVNLKGIHAPRGIFVGQWYNRKDIVDIFQQLRIQGANPESIRRAMDFYYSEPQSQ